MSKNDHRKRTHRTFRERCTSVLVNSCPVCLAGWGMCCRTPEGGLAVIHVERLTVTGPVGIRLTAQDYKRAMDALRQVAT